MPSFLFTWRSLRRAPIFAIAAIGTLAIGIGATTAIIVVLRTVVLDPLPYADADRLFSVRLAVPNMQAELGQSLATFFPLKQYAHSVDDIALYDQTAVDIADIARVGAPQHLPAALITANTFSLLGAPLALGRTFTQTEDAPHGEPVVILGNALWRQRYGADRGIIGRQIIVDGQARSVVGVTPAGFDFPDARTQVWIPAALDPRAPFARDFRHQTVVRLRRGVTPAAAAREFDAVLPRGAEQFPELFPGVPTTEFLSQSRAHTVVRPLRDQMVGSIGGVLWIAAAAGALIFLTACANVACLVLTRADRRRRDMAVRVALGAVRLRILGQYLTETIALSGVGGTVGLALAGVGLLVLRSQAAAAIPRANEIRVGGGVVLLALLLTILATVLSSAIPLARAFPAELGFSLRNRGRDALDGQSDQRTRRAFVVTQVAFAVVLVGGAILLLRSLDRLRHVRPGFNPDHAVAFWLSLPATTYPADADIVRFTARLLSRVASVPGVRGVGVSSMVPLNRLGRSYSPIWTDNDQTPVGSLPPGVVFTTATGDYFGAIGIPLIAGHTFLPLSRQRTGEVIIDQTVALQFWHDSTGQRALGHRLRYTSHDTPWYTVIGVVGNVHDTSLAAPLAGQIYLPDVHPTDSTFEQVARTFAVVVRSGVSEVPRDALRGAIRDLDPTLAVFDMRSLSEIVSSSTARLSFIIVILTMAAGVALLLAAVGLYGIVTYFVTLRTSEIGLRIALGAAPRRVIGLVTYQGAALAVVGIGVGLGLFVLVSRSLRSLLFGVGATDALTLIAMTAVLLVVAIGASWLPARRAAHIDPARTLVGEA